MRTLTKCLNSEKLRKETHVIYNYCPYGFNGVCMVNKESQCLLNKCYHDMGDSELKEFLNFWAKSRKWFNECNNNGRDKQE